MRQLCIGGVHWFTYGKWPPALQSLLSNMILSVFFVLLWGQSWRRGTKCDCKTDWLWVWSPLEEMKYLLKFIFSFLRSGFEVKRSVEFCHSTRNAYSTHSRGDRGNLHRILEALCLDWRNSTPCFGSAPEWSENEILILKYFICSNAEQVYYINY